VNRETDQSQFEETVAENLRLKGDICVHIFSVSAVMAGVCMTVIGIFQVGELRRIGSVADNVLAIDALLFLVSCVTSYFAIRTVEQSRRDHIERIADWLFLLPLSVMAAVCFVVAYELF
jgi:hypothetical protein